MAEHTYPEYVQLRKGVAPPPDTHEAAVRVYVDADGVLRTIQSDGTDTAIGGDSLAPPVVITAPSSPDQIVLKIVGRSAQIANVLEILDGAGGLAFAAGGGGQAATLVGVSDPAQNGLRVTTAPGQTSPAIIVTDEANNDCFSIGGSNGVTLSADAVGGTSEMQITTSALTFKDDNGDTVLDIEGGFTNIGPAGEIAVTAGQIYLTLPTSPGPSGTLWNDSNTVKVVP